MHMLLTCTTGYESWLSKCASDTLFCYRNAEQFSRFQLCFLRHREFILGQPASIPPMHLEGIFNKQVRLLALLVITTYKRSIPSKFVLIEHFKRAAT